MDLDMVTPPPPPSSSSSSSRYWSCVFGPLKDFMLMKREKKISTANQTRSQVEDQSSSRRPAELVVIADLHGRQTTNQTHSQVRTIIRSNYQQPLEPLTKDHITSSENQTHSRVRSIIRSNEPPPIPANHTLLDQTQSRVQTKIKSYEWEPPPHDHAITNHNEIADWPIMSSDDESEDKSSFEEANDDVSEDEESTIAQPFTFRELQIAQHKANCLLGEGGFGKVYKGLLDNNQVVAIKQLDHNGLQGNREFLVEILTLSVLNHRNLVKLIGYCADGKQRILVYRYMPLGSLTDHLHDLAPDKEPLDWNTRMKIAAGAAKGLEYLHTRANPPVIHRDLKCSNILLDEKYNPKLSDFGLAKLSPVGDKTRIYTRVAGTHGYVSPEYAMTGELTPKSDIYSFGVVLLEIITGRKAIDDRRGVPGEQNLVAWARPLLKDHTGFTKMADPMLQGRYPTKGLYRALAVAVACLQWEPNLRPSIEDVVSSLSHLASRRYHP